MRNFELEAAQLLPRFNAIVSAPAPTGWPAVLAKRLENRRPRDRICVRSSELGVD